MDGRNPRTVEEVFTDVKGRRAGMIRALTTDVDDFFLQCHPERKNLCLYGYPSGDWEVSLPAEEVPSELPEPTLGINFARDGMEEENWLYLVAIHSDAWLNAVASYFGARSGFDKNKRKRLFDMISDLPTIFEVVVRTAQNQTKDKSSLSSHGSNKSKSSSKTIQMKGEDEEEEHGDSGCGGCGENNDSDEFWICCDICDVWFHGKCVKITPEKAQLIEHYKCPSCSCGHHKRART